MKLKKALSGLSLFLVVSCGGGGGGGGGAPAETATPKSNLNLAKTKADIVCNTASEGFLFYASSENIFYSCDGTTLTAIDLKGATGATGATGAAGATGATGAAGAAGAAGLSISEIWRFHTDTYVGQPDVSTEAAATSFIGTIQLVKFSDGSALVTTNGAMLEQDSATNDYRENFSHSFMLSNSSSEQEMIIKFSSFADMRIRYKVTLATTPVFKAVVDIDGSFSNNTDSTFVLTKL